MRKDLLKNRAWIELDFNNLENNINEIKKIIHPKTKIMAVVKANAYGHGIKIVAKKLEQLGINDFAVATIEEAINLRKSNIKGNILILGYTDFSNLKYVIKYDLIQTIIDYNYSEKIKHLKLKDRLKCHIKINTGMNRIGENYEKIEKLEEIYKNKKLNVLGTFSHLCTADSKNKEDINFAKNQIKNFDGCINKLKSKNINVGKIHLQSSYGTINYPYLEYDYVRIGIIMYGVNSDLSSYNFKKLNLKNVLSLKSRIISIRQIKENDSVSYGRTFFSDRKRTIATVSIGYADGIPRNLSNRKMLVKVNGNYATIIGRICMDQLIIDISHIKEVNVGDIVTLIGSEKKISSEQLCKKSKTITNELLSRLGTRLNIIVK